MTPSRLLLAALLTLAACSASVQGTEPPPDGWANSAPTVVTRAVDRPDAQLLEVKQGALQTWVQVPAVGAKVGDHVLLGKGTARTDVHIPEIGERAPTVVEIAHIQVVDRATAERTVAARAPAGAVPIATVWAELDQRAGKSIVVHGTAVKVTSVAGSVWVHLRDGTGDPAEGTHDLALQASEPVTVGQRVTYRGVLHKDVDVGFGYHFDALVKGAQVVK